MTTQQQLSPVTLAEIKQLSATFHDISSDRKAHLDELADQLKNYYQANQRADVIVICTHNSRRSHIGQLWIQAAAIYYQLDHIKSYSGGTEATAFNHHAVDAMQSLGFALSTPDSSSPNPTYLIENGGDTFAPLFSKKFSDPANPQESFIAIMVCDSADQACPFVPGADLRFSLPFNDPKASDGTGKEQEVYLDRAREIGREMLYLISKLV